MEDKRLLFRIRNLKKYFPLKKRCFFQREVGTVCAIDNINLDIYEGETLSIVGESDCGKSTLGRTILQLYKPTEGTVEYFGSRLSSGEPVSLQSLHVTQMRKYRKDMQLIFQDPYSALNPYMTVGQMIAEGLRAQSMLEREPKKNREYIFSIMEQCGLPPEVAHGYPHQFSAQQRRRISIARSLALRPVFIIADEPVSDLDAPFRSRILNLLLELKRDHGLTYMLTFSDLSLTKYISDRVGVMFEGTIVELAESTALHALPIHPYTEALLLATPSSERRRKGRTRILEGNTTSSLPLPSGCAFYSRCKYATQICREKAPMFKEHRPNHYVACHHPLG